MIPVKHLGAHVAILESLEMPIDLLEERPIHAGFDTPKYGECVSCSRERPLSTAGNCTACGQLRNAFPLMRLQSHIVIAEHDRPSRVFTSETSKQKFHEEAIVDRSDNYWRAAFRYAVDGTDPVRHPFILAIATSKQQLMASQIRLNSDPERLVVSYNPAWGVLDASSTVDLAASRELGRKDPFADDADQSFVKRMRALDEIGIDREIRSTPEWRLHAIITGQRKAWQ